MITRYDFIKDNISSDKPQSDFSHHYNEISALYYLLGGRSDVDILTTTTKKGNFGFKIFMDKNQDAISLKESCNGSVYSIYGERYKFQCKITKADSLFIQVVKDLG